MNIYYLPKRVLATPETVPPVSRWSVSRARAHRAWWRFRLTVSELWAVLRRGGRRARLDDQVWFASEAPAPRRRPLGPARIIDLETARRRRTLAPAPAAV